MEIVIRIPEGDYNYIKGYGADAYINWAIRQNYEIRELKHYAEAIRNGIPLPKGHGALKDADEVMNVMERNCDMQDLYLPVHFKQFALDEAKTIVPADKEGAE